MRVAALVLVITALVVGYGETAKADWAAADFTPGKVGATLAFADAGTKSRGFLTGTCYDPRNNSNWPSDVSEYPDFEENLLAAAEDLGVPILGTRVLKGYSSSGFVLYGSCIQWGYWADGTNIYCAGQPDTIQVYEAALDVRDGSLFGSTTWYPGGGANYHCVNLVEAAAFFDQVESALPLPGVELSPDGRGLTGLDTWIWYDTEPWLIDLVGVAHWSPTGFTAQLDVQAWVQEIRWDVDSDGTYEQTSICDAPNGYNIPEEPPDTFPCGGSEDDPPLVHVFEEKGDTDITVEVTWTGRWRWQTQGAWQSFAPQTVTSTWSEPYPVIEIRSVVVN